MTTCCDKLRHHKHSEPISLRTRVQTFLSPKTTMFTREKGYFCEDLRMWQKIFGPHKWWFSFCLAFKPRCKGYPPNSTHPNQRYHHSPGTYKAKRKNARRNLSTGGSDSLSFVQFHSMCLTMSDTHTVTRTVTLRGGPPPHNGSFRQHKELPPPVQLGPDLKSFSGNARARSPR